MVGSPGVSSAKLVTLTDCVPRGPRSNMRGRTAIERVNAMPAGTVDVAVGDEWSFAQTLRHLVFATDVWLRRAIQGSTSPTTRSA